ncbi:MAG: 3-hydroxyacyl-CoA dehydrogenase family protein [Gemmatimonadales bacterium]|nr:MAG: 3-hydroxyacyl-CoA dehydrogenase family protein [Gemmatimonadales bacterium]
MSCESVPPVEGPVAVLGAGTMGRGIAHVSALAGFETRLFDIEAGILDQAFEAVKADLDKGVALGKVEQTDRDGALDRFHTTTDLQVALDGSGIVIEAVPERLDLKQSVLRSVADHVSPIAMIASNTSSLSISALAATVAGPERVVGLHFFNPVHIMALVEVVRGERTTERVVEQAQQFAERLGKTPIVVRDSPGFASSRLGIALGLEAIRMVEEDVASPQDIDRAMELGYRHPMGPLKLTDVVGLDVRLEIARYLNQALGGDRFRPPKLLERMVEEGRLGKKTGGGFYDW